MIPRLLILLLFLCGSAFADSLVVSSVDNVEDNYISSAAANTNYGTGTTLRLYLDNALETKMHFSIRIHGVDTLMSGLSATVDSAFLRMYVAHANQCTNYANYAGYRILKPYYETMQTYSHWKDSTGTGADSGYTTEALASAADSVDNRGNHARPDRFETAIGTITGVHFGWVSLNITELARKWMGDTVAENGIIFNAVTSPCSDAEDADTVSIYSSEYTTDATLTPRFVFYYTAAVVDSGGVGNISDTLGSTNLSDTLGACEAAKEIPGG